MIRRSLLGVFFAALLLMTAAGGSNIEKIDGLWQCDTYETFTAQGVSANPEEIAEAVEIFDPIFSSIMLQFDVKDSTIGVSDDGINFETMKYVVESASGNEFTLSLDGESGMVQLAKGSKGQELLLFYAAGKQNEGLAFVRVK